LLNFIPFLECQYLYSIDLIMPLKRNHLETKLINYFLLILNHMNYLYIHAQKQIIYIIYQLSIHFYYLLSLEIILFVKIIMELTIFN